MVTANHACEATTLGRTRHVNLLADGERIYAHHCPGLNFAKAGVLAGAITREFRVDASVIAAGAVVGVDTFAVGQEVDVTGTTKGRGFTGVIRRHHFSSNRETHGNSVSTRAPGSIGMAQDPGRVFPGKRMAGQHGNAQRTVQGLKVVRIDTVRGLLLIKGAVPGSAGCHVIVCPTVRS